MAPYRNDAPHRGLHMASNATTDEARGRNPVDSFIYSAHSTVNLWAGIGERRGIMVEDREFEGTTEEQYYKGLDKYLTSVIKLECDCCGYTIEVLESEVWQARCPTCQEMGTWQRKEEV